MEIWDAYNEDSEKIEDMILIRGETIPDGVYHLVSDVIVRHTDGDYLIMQRDRRKHFGGMWEATAGGSALQGEDAFACAKRELREETGITADSLSEVGRTVSSETHTIYVEFLCVTNCGKDSVVLQEGETSAYKWIDRDELISMKKDELVTERMQRFIHELEQPDISYVSSRRKFNYRVCGIMIHEGRILAMHDECSPYFYLPGGRVKLGETAEQAISREMNEELHISPRIIRPLWLHQGFFTEDTDHLDTHELCVYFLLSADGTGLYEKGGEFTLREGNQIHSFEWLPFERLKDEYFYPLFLKTEIYSLPEIFTLRTDFE